KPPCAQAVSLSALGLRGCPLVLVVGKSRPYSRTTDRSERAFSALEAPRRTMQAYDTGGLQVMKFLSRMNDRAFFSTMAAAMVLVVVIGFSRTYYFRAVSNVGGELPTLLQVHGAVFTSWILLFLAQTLLVASGRTDLHRRLGVVGAFLAAAVLAVGTL